MSFYTTPEERLAKEAKQCRQCEVRIEINEKLHERNVELGQRIIFLEKVVDKADKRVEKRDARLAKLEAFVAAYDHHRMRGGTLARNQMEAERKALEEGK